MHDTRLLPNHKQAPSVAQLHQDRRLPEIVAGRVKPLVGSAAKTRLESRNAQRLAAPQQCSITLVGRLLHNGVLRWSTPKVNLTENPRFTVLEPQMVRC